MFKAIATVLVKEHNRQVECLRFIDVESANYAAELLNRQPNIRWAIRGTTYPAIKRTNEDVVGLPMIDRELTTLLSS